MTSRYAGTHRPRRLSLRKLDKFILSASTVRANEKERIEKRARMCDFNRTYSYAISIIIAYTNLIEYFISKFKGISRGNNAVLIIIPLTTEGNVREKSKEPHVHRRIQE